MTSKTTWQINADSVQHTADHPFYHTVRHFRRDHHAETRGNTPGTAQRPHKGDPVQ